MMSICRPALALCLIAATLPVNAQDTPADDAPRPVDLMVTDGLVLTMDGDKTRHDRGVVVVDDDRIVAVGGAGLADRYEAETTLDVDGDIVMPGMVNLHSHLAMIAFRGLGENATGNIVLDVMLPLEKALLNRELIRTASRQAALELALGGVTLITDMYYHEDEVAEAVADVGLRGVLGETVIGFPVVDAQQPYGGLDYARDFIAAYQDHPLITPALAPHAPYTVDSEALMRTKSLSDETGAPILIHLAEFEREEVWAAHKHKDFAGRISEIAYLEKIGFLGPRVLGAHVIEVGPEDRAILKRNGVGIAHNPKSNPKYGANMAPGWEQFQEGMKVGLGTDGPMTSNQLDVLTVMRHAAYTARLRQGSNLPFTPAQLVEMATMGGARALNMEDQVGSLEAGKKADIVVVDTDAPNTQPVYDPYAVLVFSAYPGNVRHTIVNGRVVVRDRAVLTVDREAHDTAWRRVTDRVADVAGKLDIPGLMQAD